MNSYKFTDLYKGMECSFSDTITESMLESFVSLSGDHNPLHVDAVYARKKGFKDRVVHGFLSSALFSRLVGVYLPGHYCVLHSAKIKYKAPVYINDKLLISGQVVYLNEAYKQIEVKASINNHDGYVVSTATLNVGVSDE
jgi:acyl dehydratase